MIVYGRGCAGCQTIPATPQPMVEPVRLPKGVEHGRLIAYRLYGCRCDACVAANRRKLRKAVL